MRAACSAYEGSEKYVQNIVAIYKERRTLRRLGVERKILVLILRKEVLNMWIRFRWLSIGTGDGLLHTR